MDNNNNTVQTLWVAMGKFSSFALGLVSAMVLSRYFSKSEYGTYRQIIYIYSTLLVIFSAGLPLVFDYFLPRYNLAQGKEIVIKVSKVLFLTGLAFSVFLFVFSGLIAKILKNPELSTGLKYFSPIPMLLLPTMGIEGIFSSYRKTIYIAIYNTLSRTLILLFIVLPVVLFNGTYLTAIYGWIIVSIITLGIAFYFKGIPFKNVVSEKSNLNFINIFKYSMPLVLASIAGIAIKSADQFYISRFFGAEVFAEFANGFIEIPFVTMITGATAIVLMPLFSKIVNDKTDVNKLVTLWQNALKKSVILIYPMVVFFLFFSKDIMTVLYSATYSGASRFFSTAMTVNFFNVIVFSPLLFSLGETRFYARIHIFFAFLIWIGEYFIVKIFNDPLSIAIFSVSIQVSIILISLGYVSKITGISISKLFPVGRLFIIALHSIVTLLAVKMFINFALSEISTILYLSLSGFGYLVLLWMTSKWFKINYLEIIIPIFKRNNSQTN